MPPDATDIDVDPVGVRWRREVDRDTVRHFAYSAIFAPSEALQRQWGGRPPLIVATTVAGRVASIVVNYSDATSRLWWVEFPETSTDPPAFALVGFETPAVPAGSVIDLAAFSSIAATNDDQVAAFRWWPANGEAHQIYVSPTRRREGLGSGILVAAWAYCRLRGWPPLWGTGQRTDLGESLVMSTPRMRMRTQKRTHVLPPMTPPDAAEGLDRRLVEPDP